MSDTSSISFRESWDPRLCKAHRDELCLKIAALERLLHQRLELEAKATEKAEVRLTQRLEGMNEIRSAMSDQAAHYITRETFEAKVDALSLAVQGIEKRQANFDGRTIVFVGALAVVISLATGFLLRLL